MHHLLSKRIETPWLSHLSQKITCRVLVMWLVCLGLSLLAWRSTHYINMGLYPDYDEHLSDQMASQVRAILMVTWSVWLASLFAKSRITNCIFIFGVCLAFCWCVIRLQFMREVISVLHL
jgi:predicted ABC-type exoprotein transport system permease subunit